MCWLNTRPYEVNQCQEGENFDVRHKKAPEKVLFYTLFIIYKLALLLQLFLSEEIGEQRGA
ncbi:Uncharacterised protein [Klebsiella pneumoniae subsp. rhinoscleromatis]|nr:Uncharacterised protein [Klebsiella pneumoniae]STW13658.1 Uncharacterised protein [Klebsiella pneumoniae subsp. rhinoscleromatis]